MKRFQVKRLLFALFLSALATFPTGTMAEGQLGNELYEAVLFQDLLQVEALIAKGADVNHRERGRPILGWAAQSGSVPIVDALLKAKADPNLADEGIGHTPLIRAIETQQLGIIRSLLKAKANPNARSNDGKTCLMFAIESRKPQVVQALITMGADVKRVEADGNSPALVAAQDGMPESLEVIKILGKAGATLDASNIIYTPLIYAIQQGNIELTSTLLDAGANPNAPSSSGQIPLFAALDNPEMIKLLLTKKANPNLAVEGETPLLKAVQAGYVETTKLLLEGGADREAKDIYGATPLEIAERNFNSEIVALLKPSATPAQEAVVDYPAIPVGAAKSGECTIVDAARMQMEIHGLLQAQVDAGKMDSNIFRTFSDDTKEYGELLVKNPNEACKLLERLRKKYGV